MSEIVALVEGQTEQAFIRDQLAARLGCQGISIWAVLSGKTRRQGGVKKWDVARNDILRTLKEGRYCTTMFDYYGMPLDWPGRDEAVGMPWRSRAAHVEIEMKKDVIASLDQRFNPAQFIPYVQLHEFESLLFSNTTELAGATTAVCSLSASSLRKSFDAILRAAGHPEAIDDGFETCPSRRITSIVPGFRKRLHGPIVTQRIGLDELAMRCSHFGEWVARLEALGGAG